MAESEDELSSCHSGEASAEEGSEPLGELPPFAASTNVNITNSDRIHVGPSVNFMTPQLNVTLNITDKDGKIQSVEGKENDEHGILSLIGRCFSCTQYSSAGENQPISIEAAGASGGETRNPVNYVENLLERILPETVTLNGNVETHNSSEHANQYESTEAYPLKQLTQGIKSPGGENGEINFNGEREATNFERRFPKEPQILRLGVTVTTILIFISASSLIAVLIAKLSNIPVGGTADSDTITTTSNFTNKRSTHTVLSGPDPTDGTKMQLEQIADEMPELDQDINWKWFGLTEDETKLYATLLIKTSTSTPVQIETSGWSYHSTQDEHIEHVGTTDVITRSQTDTVYDDGSSTTTFELTNSPGRTNNADNTDDDFGNITSTENYISWQPTRLNGENHNEIN